MCDNLIIAVSGKGGTGKTVVSSILVKLLSETGKDLLVIDADPDSNIPESLGIEVDKSVGDVREDLKKDVNQGNISSGMNKWDILDYKIMESIVETQNFDLLMMGRSEGSGCYCAVNNMLRRIIENISSNYDYIVIDTEAGLEHLSRRTTQSVDIMLVVSDSSRRGLHTASRVGKLSKELKISFEQIYFILNRVKMGNEEELSKKAKETGLDIIGLIHDDEVISEFDLEGRSLMELPNDSEPVKVVKDIIDKLKI
ncbi:Light-independent protochlorophyllide reductase iron-sulfur ATP-binding protein [Candidatus Methanobinarius endosymbioticus]|uniref:Light-independent protochlorophyllide reductase iron-sulfur ATP-binding protein n=1 Tax=Candidatus Methanobinarius endosymbioticus TaxID=2006182 RepID=A0A366MCZ6_9EURY|nr:Light-independent protochlorophyllide reductase iron-sulfur ATP-binding protein [Candidatus Methanobinarius endosymbioticus]